jgi:hypothetical protein
MICLVNLMKLILKMTVVEAYFGGTKLDPCYDTSQILVQQSRIPECSITYY